MNKFPNGIKYVADAVHALGLKFGIYRYVGNSDPDARSSSDLTLDSQ